MDDAMDRGNPPDPNDPNPRLRADGKVWCCSTLGWVTPEVAADHRWDTSRPPEEYERDYAGAWDLYVKERGG